MVESAINLLNEISNLGYEAYLVGGYPRDLYLGKENDDIDICTNMKPENILTHFHIIAAYPDLGSFKIEYQTFIFEITTYRKEGIYKNYRKPDTVTFIHSLKEDLKRRDFTINTLCIDKDKNFIDLLGAKEDLEKKIIRVVGKAEKKLSEDPLRIIRALRFAASLNFSLDKEIETFIIKHPDELKKIPKKKAKKELERLNEEEQKKFFLVCQNLGIKFDIF